MKAAVASRFIGGLTCLMIALSGVGAQPVTQSLDLGSFRLASFEGIVQIQGKDGRLSVVLGIDNPSPRPVPSDVQVWLLLKDGISARQVDRNPKLGEVATLRFVGGGDRIILMFGFEDGAPVALVLGIGGEYRVFPITSKIPR